MINRDLENEILQLKNEFPIVAILGPRQSGKTTISKKIFTDYKYVTLEDLDTREFATNDPRGFLETYDKNIIFDEIQRVPELMSYLQSHVDRMNENGKIIITGSHNFLLMEQISQSLAGRVGITKLLTFSYKEISHLDLKIEDLIFQGSYPRIYDQGIRPPVFYNNYISTYIEKDIRQLKHITKIDDFYKFIKILAGRTGQELNTNSLGDELGLSHNTIKEWITVLEASFLIYKLKPYHKNYNKRIIKNPKIYFTDTGLVCSLLGIRKKEELNLHYLKGSLFETFIVNEFIKSSFNYGDNFDIYFWRDNHKKEIDLILDSGIDQYAFEIKSSKTFHEKYFDTMKYWENLTENNRDKMHVIYGGVESYIRNDFNVVSWKDVYEKIIAKVI